MSNVFEAAWVIARRDFVATVWSRTFLLFLLAPIIAFGFALLIGLMTRQADLQARQPTVAVVMDSDSERAVRAAHARPGVRARRLPASGFAGGRAGRLAEAGRKAAGAAGNERLRRPLRDPRAAGADRSQQGRRKRSARPSS